MNAALDSSVLVEALARNESRHAECFALLQRGGWAVYAHALLETFSNLTGGRLAERLSPQSAARLIESTVLPRVTVVELDAAEQMAALGEAQRAGARGGAIYDFLHLVAARKARAPSFVTLDLSDFRAFTGNDLPRIVSPLDFP